MMWPEIILVIALWEKSKMASISTRLSHINYHYFRQNGQKSIILVSAIGFSGMRDIVCDWKVH